MAPSKGPKRLAAEEQVALMRSQGIKEEEIKTRLYETGLTKLQVNQIVGEPVKEAEKPKPVLDDEMRAANINGAVHFLEGMAQKLTPNICDRFTELGTVKHDALTWSRKLKGLL